MMATYCLLQSIVRDGGWTALDPAVVNSALILQGRDPRRLTARGYGTLQEQFAGARILQANLISFSSRRATARVEDPLSGGTGAGPGSKLLDAFNLLVIRVDADTRMITASSQVYDQDSESAGWFGHLVEKSLLHRLKNSARELWGALRPKLEDS